MFARKRSGQRLTNPAVTIAVQFKYIAIAQGFAVVIAILGGFFSFQIRAVQVRPDAIADGSSSAGCRFGGLERFRWFGLFGRRTGGQHIRG
ncbi:MAG: hypothetical protein C4540_02545 [Candidatus Omnitrophota bacterium]|nr:MAG: hypothetical protein C4540_02545 [Candidatus Omnitrophota bacterium]